MIERTAVIAAAAGLHARPAAAFAYAAAEQQVPVEIAKLSAPELSVQADSLLGVMSLDVAHGERVLLRARGEGAEQVLETLVQLLEESP
ncbi:phosphocarrier protein [Nesterenkonia jeotgali]|uniref:Phosphocarrier protein HPr n=3 Tax=Nesterenkonia TaxID=57494 RepID=A0A839FRU1_9MICC|nr:MULTISPECIES: HPr family phosphocarrier protein [Nesterenkonia]MBA8922766.1 phosphocarrier protein [Nesterenkonia jeotgali]NYJ15763.1 phosphocarrier protein [Nesterenkonia sandarakina]